MSLEPRKKRIFAQDAGRRHRYFHVCIIVAAFVRAAPLHGVANDFARATLKEALILQSYQMPAEFLTSPLNNLDWQKQQVKSAQLLRSGQCCRAQLEQNSIPICCYQHFGLQKDLSLVDSKKLKSREEEINSICLSLTELSQKKLQTNRLEDWSALQHQGLGQACASHEKQILEEWRYSNGLTEL